MLFISHDLDVVMSMADRVAVMRHGRLIEQGTVQGILHAPRSDYTRELTAAHAHRAKPRNGIRPAEVQHAIRTQALCVDYGRGAGRRRAVHHIDLTVRQGTTLGVAGKSGSGKSTIAGMSAH